VVAGLLALLIIVPAVQSLLNTRTDSRRSSSSRHGHDGSWPHGGGLLQRCFGGGAKGRAIAVPTEEDDDEDDEGGVEADAVEEAVVEELEPLEADQEVVQKSLPPRRLLLSSSTNFVLSLVPLPRRKRADAKKNETKKKKKSKSQKKRGCKNETQDGEAHVKPQSESRALHSVP
jgi:hypothetical protein